MLISKTFDSFNVQLIPFDESGDLWMKYYPEYTGRTVSCSKGDLFVAKIDSV